MNRSGIAVRGGHVAVGEEGRGRELVRIPVVGLVDGELAAARVGRDAAGRAVLAALPADDTPEGRVLVLLNAHGGWRGSVRYELPPVALVLATGYVAQGDAGRAGGWEEHLAVLPVPCEVPYRTSGGGGHEGGPRWLRVLDGETLVEENADERGARLAREAAEAGRVEWL